MGLLDDSEERNARDQLTPQWYAALYVRVCGGKSRKDWCGHPDKGNSETGGPSGQSWVVGCPPLVRRMALRMTGRAHVGTARVKGGFKGRLQISASVMACQFCGNLSFNDKNKKRNVLTKIKELHSVIGFRFV